MSDMNNIIEIHDLRKMYGKDVLAVDDISFDVREGEVFGFLGPNGAGKSTTISMITTLLTPTSGTITIGGYDVMKDSTEVRKTIGLVPQSLTADDELSGRENMELHSDLYNVPRDTAKTRIDELLKIMKLEDAADRRVDTYSGGMRKRLELAEGLIHRPKILFLDEPTLGLDIQTREIIWEYIRNMKNENGMTVFLTTHYLEEADSLCDRIAIIDNGKIAIIGTPDELKASLGGDIIYATIEGEDRTSDIMTIDGVSNVERTGFEYRVTVKNGDEAMTDLLSKISKNSWIISSISLHKPSMNQVFLHYTGKSLKNESTGRAEVHNEMNQMIRRR